MNIDIDQIGYRWKGIYSEFLAYKDNDVVYKDGGAYVIRNGAPEPFALGQQDAVLRGHLLTGGVSAGGFGNMVLHSNGAGGVEFRFQDRRNGTLVTALMDTDNRNSYYSSSHNMQAIMADTSVRSWGSMAEGAGGAGVQAIGRTFPTRVPFPPGTPRIVSIRTSWHDTFYLDAGGGLWHAGRAALSGRAAVDPIPRRMNGLGDLGANTKVVKVFSHRDVYDYAMAACIDDAGRVYIWGSNQYNAQGLVGTSPAPRLVPFTVDVPIRDVFLGAGEYSASWLVSTQGQLYVAGQTDISGFGGGANVFPHRYWMPWGPDKPVKKVVYSETDHHITAGAQYTHAICLLLENGDLYRWGGSAAGYVDGGWGTGYIGGVYPSESSLHPYKINSNVRDVGTINGLYMKTVALMMDGTVQHSGDSNYGIGDGVARTVWATIGGTFLQNGTKLLFNGYQYGTTACLLRSDGRAVVWGQASVGVAGNGLGTESQLPNSFVLLDKTIIDVQMSGYNAPGDNGMTYHFLTSDGQVYSTGYSISGITGDDDDQNRFTPAQILF
jgi:alpha-tubulin suppressor-like RCC1 family protein